MSSLPSGGAADKLPPWVTCLDVEEQEAGHYEDHVNEALLQAVQAAPARVLELGCASGAFGARLKQRFPSAHVIGIEAGRGAAAHAATRLDRVINARIEDVDFATEGIAPQSLDLLVAGDVLEHLVNPWAVLKRARPFLAGEGRVVASIPNARNLQVSGELLINGRFTYDERGLLDITHLRFFTFEEIRAMFEQTGYALESFVVNLSPRLSKLYHEHAGKGEVTLKLGRMTLEGVTQRELTELCAEQFILRARPA
ncbi:MAG: methyltransferase domain-containing protein [Usitatibacter sp.]